VARVLDVCVVIAECLRRLISHKLLAQSFALKDCTYSGGQSDGTGGVDGLMDLKDGDTRRRK